MSNTIKLKRGSGSDPSANDLVVGELAIRTDSGKIFTKKDNGSVAEISGGGAGLEDGNKGDITVSNGGDTFTINNGVVTSAKIADGTIDTEDLGDLIITNAKVATNAAIAGSKIDPTFTSSINISRPHSQLTLTDTDDSKFVQFSYSGGKLITRNNSTSTTTAQFTLDESGRLGIGTTSPGVELEIFHATDPEIHLNINTHGDVGKIKGDADGLHLTGNGSSNQIRFNTNSTERMRIDSSGNVGIGGTAPNYQLHVVSGIGVGAHGFAQQLSITNNKIQSLLLGTGYTDMSINALGGNVGIGTTNPDGNKLFVQLTNDNSNAFKVKGGSSQGRTNIAVQAGNASSGSITAFRLINSSGTGIGSFHMDNSTDDINIFNGSQGGKIFFHTNESGSTLKKMTITDTGRLGIGTTSPSANLHSYHATANEAARFESGDEYVHVVFKDSTTTSVPYIGAQGNNLRAITGGAERMKIDVNGSVFAVGIYNATTGSSADGVVVSSGGKLRRVTSSQRYKTSIETLEDKYADAILEARPVWYKSLCEDDDKDYSHWGFIAEEIEKIDPRLCSYKTVEIVIEDNERIEKKLDTPIVESVQYERFVPHLVNLIKRQDTRIKLLEAKVEVLEAK